MSDSALVMGTIYAPNSAPSVPALATNKVQVIVIGPANVGREYVLASENALMSLWMTPEEEEAWKDL